MSTFKSSALTEPEITGPGRTAHHEAGHSVMAMSFGFQVHAISASPVDTADGRSWINVPSFLTETDHVKLALVAAAGLAAEAHFCQISGMTNAASIGHYGDKRKANESMNAIGHEGLFSFYLNWANEYLIQPSVWRALSELVNRLQKEGLLSDPDAIAIIARTVPPFDPKLFEKKLRLIEDLKRLGLLSRIQDPFDGIAYRQ